MAPKPSRITTRISSARVRIRASAAPTERSVAAAKRGAVDRLVGEGLHGAQRVQRSPRRRRRGRPRGPARRATARARGGRTPPAAPPPAAPRQHQAGELGAGHHQHDEGADQQQRRCAAIARSPSRSAPAAPTCRRSGGTACRRCARFRTKRATARSPGRTRRGGDRRRPARRARTPGRSAHAVATASATITRTSPVPPG